jgi:hypothetical protein
MGRTGAPEYRGSARCAAEELLMLLALAIAATVRGVESHGGSRRQLGTRAITALFKGGLRDGLV